MRAQFRCSLEQLGIAEEEDTVEGVAVPEGETVRDLQNQKTHVQSSEALAYLARFLFSFASLRRFSIS